MKECKFNFNFNFWCFKEKAVNSRFSEGPEKTFNRLYITFYICRVIMIINLLFENNQMHGVDDFFFSTSTNIVNNMKLLLMLCSLLNFTVFQTK